MSEIQGKVISIPTAKPAAPQTPGKPSAPVEAQPAKLQVIEYGGGKIFELDRGIHNHNFLAVIRGHEGRFMSLTTAELWINSVNHHQGHDEKGKKL